MLRGIAKIKQKTCKIAGKLPPTGLVKKSFRQNCSVENFKARVLTAYIAKGQSKALITDKIKKKRLLLELLLSIHVLAKMATAINPQNSFAK